MPTVKEDLWKTLENLTDKEFRQFKWLLKDGGDGTVAIPASRLEKADRQDTVDVMVQMYGEAKAKEKSSQVLEKIHRNDLAQQLSKTSLAQTGKFQRGLDEVCSKSENEKLKSRLREMKAEIRLRIKEREMKISEIRRSVELSKKYAERQIVESLHTFTFLMQSVEKCLSDLTEAIEDKQNMTQKHIDRIIKELEQEIFELTRREAELEDLLLTENNQKFLQDLKTSNLTEIDVPKPSYGETVMTSVNKLKELLYNEMEKFLSKANLIRMQQFAVDVTLDPDTAHPNLVLSGDGKQVHFGDGKQNLPDNPERFDTAVNVLARQNFSSGRVYFEVQVRGKTAWDLGVVYKSIDRKGSITARTGSGHWAIGLRSGDTFKAAGVKLNVKTPLNKVGVFVDYEKAVIMFYNVDSAELIHRYSDCSFKENLYPFFSPSINHGGLNSCPLIITHIT